MTPQVKTVTLAAVLLLVGTPAVAQSAYDAGRTEYQSSCASCHGATLKGDGPLRQYMTKPPTDLTTLSRRHGGAFPTQLVWEMVDGRTSTDIGPHGSREMPIWGERYRQQALQNPATAQAPEWHVRGQILAMLDYLNRLQVR